MAAFPPPFGAGIAFGAIVPSGGGAGLGLNGINDNLPKAPNFVDGATYTPSAPVIVAGSGLHVSGTGWRVLSGGDLIVNSGGFITAASGAILRAQSGATWQVLFGANLDITGTITLKNSGGPGAFVVETGTTVTFNNTSALTISANAVVTVNTNAWVWSSTSTQTYSSGTVAGGYTRTGVTAYSGASARSAYRVKQTLSASADEDVSVAHDRFQVPLTLTGNRLYRLCHSGVASTPIPNAGERVKVYRTGATVPSAHTAKIRREDGTVLFSFYASRQGSAEFEFNGTEWEFVDGQQYASGAQSGYYDDVW